jgi:hypothetical protein
MGDSNTAGGVETIIQEAAESIGNLILNNTNENLTSSGNETERFKATPEGLFIAYSSLVIMALIPIIVGSFKSVKHQKAQQVSSCLSNFECFICNIFK